MDLFELLDQNVKRKHAGIRTSALEAASGKDPPPEIPFSLARFGYDLRRHGRVSRPRCEARLSTLPMFGGDDQPSLLQICTQS